MAGTGFLAFSKDPPSWIGWLGVPVLALFASTMMQNSFGLDRGAVDRYRLLPLSGVDVLLSKNVAFLVVLAVLLFPALIATALRFDVITALRGLLLAGVLTSVSVTFGNITSVRYPWPKRFFAFNSNRDGNVLANLGYSFTLMALVGVGALLGRLGLGIALVVQAGLFAAGLLLYRNRLKATGRMFDTSARSMREKLSE